MYLGKMKPIAKRAIPACECATPMLTRPGPGGWISTPMRGLSGLGWMEYVGAVASLFGDKGGGGGGAAPAPSIFTTTTTNVNTQVNPQISPVFVQQSEPEDSPVSTAITQTQPQMPGTMPPITGATPGMDWSRPMLTEGNTPLIAAAALLGLAFVASRRTGGGKRRSRR